MIIKSLHPSRPEFPFVQNPSRKAGLSSLLLLLILLSACVHNAPLSSGESASSSIQLSPLFGNNMVLQRGKPVPVWGQARPGELVQVSFQNQTVAAMANPNGDWKVELAPLKVGGPFEMIVAVPGQTPLRLRNIMVGEVWVCSGQSNMEMGVGWWGGVINYWMERTRARHPNLRLMTVRHQIASTPQREMTTSSWEECTSQTVDKFSATGYFFGRELQNHLDIPIGLIQSAWGGTAAEAWTSAEGLASFPEYKPLIDGLKSLKHFTLADAKKNFEEGLVSWRRLINSNDAGHATSDTAVSWANPNLDSSTWKIMQLPEAWEKRGLPDFDGIVWFRKQIHLPASCAGTTLTLQMGLVDDSDITWFNGVQIGATIPCCVGRTYTIPGPLVREGINDIAIRVLDIGGLGGIGGAPEELRIDIPKTKGSDKPTSIPLDGPWAYQISLDLKTLPPGPADPEYPHWPSCLYNGMIAPLMPFAIQGVIWYQGESNTGRAYQYRTLFPALIRDWRTNWRQGDFPFLFVQLAAFKVPALQPTEDDWAELREAQTMTLSLPNTGMAVAIDIGDAFNIHPRNKQELGRRLALAARAIVYGEKIVYSGPIYRPGSMKIEGGDVRLEFDHTGSGLVTGDGSSLTGFSIAGEDRKFVWAQAKIEGNTVVVSSQQVPHPVAVRYAWASNPVCNLFNKEGLPASPFRTDVWPGITGK